METVEFHIKSHKVDINYQRNFNMASVSASAPLIDRTITIHKGNTLVYNRTQNRLQPNKGGIVGNALNELAVFLAKQEKTKQT